MAQKVQVVLTDDLDGAEAVETVTLSLDGVTYELDLNEKNAAKLRKALEPFVSAARRVSRGRGRPGGRKRQAAAPSGDLDPAAVRAWAAANKIHISPRGRISSAVLEQFHAADR
jgi:hypothetical protein